MDYSVLIDSAFEAQKNSYSPYSSCKVGAALLGKNGKIYMGCNIENAAYSPSNCAERTAFFTAVASGERNFSAIAIVGNNGKDDWFYPCGVCRQVMKEFCTDDFVIIVAKSRDEYHVCTLGELLPNGFGREQIK